MKGQKLVHRHRFEIMRFHFRFHFFNPDDLSLSKAASAQGPILGDYGPLQWSKKAKNERPNPHGHSTIVQRLPFRRPEVALGSRYSTGIATGGRRTTGFVSRSTALQCGMPTLTRRYPERPDCWHISYGDVRVDTIARRVGNPFDTDPWVSVVPRSPS